VNAAAVEAAVLITQQVQALLPAGYKVGALLVLVAATLPCIGLTKPCSNRSGVDWNAFVKQ
jgi:hypothetical protein